MGLGSKVLPQPWGLLLILCGATVMVDSEPTCISAVAATALGEPGKLSEDGTSSCFLLQREGHAVDQTAKRAHSGAARTLGLPENSSQSPATSDGAGWGGSAGPGAYPLQSEARAMRLPENGSQSSAASDAAGLGGSAGPGANLSSAVPAVGRAHVSSHPKSPVVLIVIEMFPPAWLLGIDRFYLGSIRTGIAKLIFSVASFGIGGLIWGLIDCCTVFVNTLQRRRGIHSLGMAANFEHDQLQTAFYLALALIPVLAVEAGIWRLFWKWRKGVRLTRLKDAALKSPHLGLSKNSARK